MPDMNRYKQVMKTLSKYNRYGFGDKDEQVLVSEIIEMLKDRAPVYPRQYTNNDLTWWYICSRCKTAIDPGDRFCRHCGGTIMWDGGKTS